MILYLNRIQLFNSENHIIFHDDALQYTERIAFKMVYGYVLMHDANIVNGIVIHEYRINKYKM